jgi:GNAT superfamily N-acetyltransferase
MQVRTLRASEREALLTLLDGWPQEDGWSGRDFFRRYVEDDPSFDEDNVWVATEAGRLVACVQIFPRGLRVRGRVVPSGGIGSVFTRPEVRASGVASALLSRAAEAMRERGMELSLLFAQRLDFYTKRGWRSWTRPRLLAKAPAREPRGAGAGASGAERAQAGVAFDPARHLGAVKEVHRAYDAARSGVVERDDALWDASLLLAGNPREEFVVCEGGEEGAVVAYARAIRMSGVLLVAELGRLEGRGAALASLVAGLLGPRGRDPLATPERPSPVLRAFAVLPCFDDPELMDALAGHGLALDCFPDPSSMLRCLDPPGLARRLELEIGAGEDAETFLARALPPAAWTFWPADRF